MADKWNMFTIYAIDRDGLKHGDIECPTLEDALESLEQLALDSGIDSEPDDPYLVRYGITFANPFEFAQQLKAVRS